MLMAIAKTLSALNSEAGPGQISLAFCFAMIAGLTPLFSLHNLLVLFLILLFRVNLPPLSWDSAFFQVLHTCSTLFFTGFGLGIMKKIVEAHGGEVSSRPNRGV